MRLIDADALIETLEREAADERIRNTPTNWANAFCVFVDRLEEAPTIDAASVRRGEWGTAWDGYSPCLVCGYQYAQTDFRHKALVADFCPKCGADMRGTHG